MQKLFLISQVLLDGINVIGETGVDRKGRGVEIRNWLVKNGKDVGGFVVIDDKFRELFGESLPEGHFVETYLGKSNYFDKEKEGLTEAKAKEAFICLMKSYN